MTYIIVVFSAIISALPLYFSGIYFLSWFSFIPILFVLNKIKLRKSIFVGWLFGFVYTGIASYWLIYPLKNFSGLSIFPAFIVWIMLMAVIAVFYSGWAYMFKNIGVGPLRAALSWTGMEFIRYSLFSVFPIGYLAYTQVDFNSLLQWADIGGIFLISFVTMLVNGFFYKLLKDRKRKYLFTIIIIFSLIFSYGFYSITDYQKVDNENNFKVAIVQTNIEQSQKWNADMIDENINKIFSNLEKLENINLLITPETALTFDLIRNEYYREKVFKKIKKHNMYFQLGAQAIKDKSTSKYNSTFLLNPEAKIKERYNKNRLVPFGEVIPFNNLVNFVTGIRWYSLKAGKQSPIFSIGKMKWKNLICSEILYPIINDDISEFSFIVNQSNEAWFGSGLQNQMWSASVFRAVESRKTVLRAGNYAQCGVILPTGKKHIKKNKDAKEIFVAEIKLNKNTTFYSKHGNYIGYICAILFTLLTVLRSGVDITSNSEK